MKLKFYPRVVFEPSLCCPLEARWADGGDGKCSTTSDVEGREGGLCVALTSKLGKEYQSSAKFPKSIFPPANSC